MCRCSLISHFSLLFCCILPMNENSALMNFSLPIKISVALMNFSLPIKISVGVLPQLSIVFLFIL